MRGRRTAVALIVVVVGVSVLATGGPAATRAACEAFGTPPAYRGQVRTAQQVLGFGLGTQEVTSVQSDAYLAAVDADSPRVVTGTAAVSAQQRPLRYAIVGREANVTPSGLAAIRLAARQLMNPATPASTAAALAASTPAILWITGNVHGNEESGADASLRALYELADRSDCVADRILDNAVVVILPIQNPDGRELDTRRNAYGFDMNRDWFARTQPETDGKLELLRQYPPVLYVDAHEFSFKTYFFPPNADPVYHEVAEQPFGWINGVFGAAIETEMNRQKIPFFHGSPYDLYAAEYGDTVPTLGFNAAGMTFEKHNGDSVATRTYEHFVSIWTSLFAAASQKGRILGEWHDAFVQARDEGAAGTLEPNAITFDGKTLYQQVPNRRVRHYFLLDTTNRSVELARLVRRLQRMDVSVYRLRRALSVPDFTPYAGATTPATLPAGTYWIPMAQAQKHWIQAMLHEDPYIPTSFSYDVTAWSNPLLLNLEGGSSGAVLSPSADLVPPVAPPQPPGPPPGAPRIGLWEMPGSTTAFQSAGALRSLFDRVWGVPYQEVSAADITAGLPGIDVLIVPDGYVNYGLQALGAKGKKALADWVEAGGRYVGYLGGTELAARSGVSTVVLQSSHTSAPGTLLRVKLDPASPLDDGIGASAWVMYDDDDRLTPGLGSQVGTFPAPSDSLYGASGLAIGVDELAGTAAIVDEHVGSGRAVLFSFDPNFRGWTDGTQRVLWNALYGSAPGASAPVPAKVRSAALSTAQRAADDLPGLGRAIRIVVWTADAPVTRELLASYGAEFKERAASDRMVFLIANRKGMSIEDHPFALVLAQELRTRISTISFSVPG